MSRQIAVKLPETMLDEVDDLVLTGSVASRADAVRKGLRLLLRSAQRSAVDRAYRDGYATAPETDEEVAEAHRLGVASIEEEPWERWW